MMTYGEYPKEAATTDSDVESPTVRNVSDDYFVLDAVTHAFNVERDNFSDIEGAAAMAEMAANFASGAAAPAYQIDKDKWLRNWSVDELANILFRESRTDVAAYHPLPIYSFKDGLSSLEKSLEALQKYPTRFIGGYACIDPMRGKEALVELERQVELYAPYGGPLGLKMYPASWHDGNIGHWKMNDPKIAYPVLEKAAELGIGHVAVHKSIPIEPSSSGTPSTSRPRGRCGAFPGDQLRDRARGSGFRRGDVDALGKIPERARQHGEPEHGGRAEASRLRGDPARAHARRRHARDEEVVLGNRDNAVPPGLAWRPWRRSSFRRSSSNATASTCPSSRSHRMTSRVSSRTTMHAFTDLTSTPSRRGSRTTSSPTSLNSTRRGPTPAILLLRRCDMSEHRLDEPVYDALRQIIDPAVRRVPAR